MRDELRGALEKGDGVLRLLALGEVDVRGASEQLELVEDRRGDFDADGITVCTGAPAERISHDGTRFTVHLGGTTITAERLLVATGRQAGLAKLGIGTIGLDEEAHVIPTDGWMRAAPGVWALGDVTGKGAFTHMSMYQADIVVRDILGQGGEQADYRAVPRVTFTDPEIGSVGQTEEQARAAGLRVRTGHAQIPASSRGWIHKAGNDGFIKVVEDADREVLVGATSAGPYGGEVLSALQVAVRAEVPVATLRNMPSPPDLLPRHLLGARPSRVIMTYRPAVVAFDVIETLMSIEPLRERLTAAGQPPHLLEAWYTRTLRDGMALSATGDYVAFTDVAESALRGLTNYSLGDEQVAQIMAGFAELPAFPDAVPAITALTEAGVWVACLTNGSAYLARPSSIVPGSARWWTGSSRSVRSSAGAAAWCTVTRRRSWTSRRSGWPWSPRTTGIAMAPSGPG